MAAQRPKPRYDGKQKPPYGDFLDWLDRQFTEVFGSNYKSLAEVLAAVVAGVDLSAINIRLDDLEDNVDLLFTDVADLQFDVADLDARIDDLEAEETAFKTYPICGSVSNPGQASGGTFYHRPIGEVTSTGVLTRGQIFWPRAGTLSNFRVRNIVSSADPDTKTWWVNINGVDTTMTVGPIAGTSTSLFSDTTHTATIAVGDLLTIRSLNQVSGTGVVASDSCWSIDFTEDP